eukprot:5091447-Prorocentrum_lima.AAC.1
MRHGAESRPPSDVSLRRGRCTSLLRPKPWLLDRRDRLCHRRRKSLRALSRAASVFLSNLLFQ